MIFFDEKRLSSVHNDMMSARTQISRFALEVEDASLRLFHCMNSAILQALFREARQDLSACASNFTQLCRGLDEICQIYKNCECDISDDGENALIRYSEIEVGMVDLSDARDILNELSFSI